MYSVDAAKEPQYEPQEQRGLSLQAQKRLVLLVFFIVIFGPLIIFGFITNEYKRPPVKSSVLNQSKNDVANVPTAAEPISPAVIQESAQIFARFFTKHARVIIPVAISCLMLLAIIMIVTGVVFYRKNLQRLEAERLAEEARIAAKMESGVTDGAGKETSTLTWTEWWGRNLKVIYGTSILCGFATVLLFLLAPKMRADLRDTLTLDVLIVMAVLAGLLGCGAPFLLYVGLSWLCRRLEKTQNNSTLARAVNVLVGILMLALLFAVVATLFMTIRYGLFFFGV